MTMLLVRYGYNERFATIDRGETIVRSYISLLQRYHKDQTGRHLFLRRNCVSSQLFDLSLPTDALVRSMSSINRAGNEGRDA